MYRNNTTILFVCLILTNTIWGCTENNSKSTVKGNTTAKDTLLETVYLTADSTGTVNWQLKENNADSILIQQFRWNRWITLHVFISKESSPQNTFTCKIPLHAGNNYIRLICRGKDGTVKYSEKIEAFSKKPNIRIYDKTPYTEFTDSTMYEVYNEQGKLIISGKGTIIRTDTLPKGVYYLNYDNVMTEFVKKD